MNRYPWFGSAILFVFCAAVVLAMQVGPLYGQDRPRQTEPTPQRPARQPIHAQSQQRVANAATHRVEISQLDLPDDTRVITPITAGLSGGADAGPGTARRRVDVVYHNISLGGTISAQHDMIGLFERHHGAIYEISITILSASGEEVREFTAQVRMVEVSLDLETRTWELELVLIA